MKRETHEEFQELVANIRMAEDESERVKLECDKRIAEFIRKGREKCVEIRETYEKKAAEKKNTILADERKKTEKIVEKIITDANKEADELRKKKLSKKGLASVFDYFTSLIS